MPRTERERVINTSKGTTIRGIELIPEKLAKLVAIISEEEYDDAPIWSIVFHKDKPLQMGANGPEPIYGHLDPNVRTIEVNLSHHFERMKWYAENGLQMRGMVWIWWQILMTIYHETYHGWEYENTPSVNRYKFRGNCTKADAWALDKVRSLAKRIDIEPSRRNNGFLYEMINTWEETLLENSAPWAQLQYSMTVTGKAFLCKNSVIIETLKEFLRLGSGEHTDPSWALVFEPKQEQVSTVPACVSEMEPIVAMVPPTESIYEPDEIVQYQSMFDERNGFIEEELTVEPNPNSLPLTKEQIEECASRVFGVLHSHIYTKCNFEAGVFSKPGAVIEPVFIGNIPGAEKLFVSMETTDDMGRPCKKDIWPSGLVKGKIIAGGKLPCYTLILRNDTKRDLIPQNPNKTKNGVLTSGARMAREGKEISYVFKDNEITISYQAHSHQVPICTINPFNNLKKRVINL